MKRYRKRKIKNIKNKVAAVIMLTIAILATILCSFNGHTDITLLLFFVPVSIGLFFAKKNYVLN